MLVLTNHSRSRSRIRIRIVVIQIGIHTIKLNLKNSFIVLLFIKSNESAVLVITHDFCGSSRSAIAIRVFELVVSREISSKRT